MNLIRALFLAIAGLGPIAAPAQDGAFDFYLDDRSSATGLIYSLFNAINRREYARAWSYWGEGALTDYEVFVAGYERTERVELLTGPETSEGAAGSLYYTIPVAIEAHASDGGITVFAGCYVLRLLQPSFQEPPFRPMHIERGRLRVSDLPLAESLPASCAE